MGQAELRHDGVLRSSPRAAVSLRHRPILMWRTEVGKLGEVVLMWPHPVLRHLPVRQDGEHVIAHIIGRLASELLYLLPLRSEDGDLLGMSLPLPLDPATANRREERSLPKTDL